MWKADSSKVCRFRWEKKFWLVIGGERGKCRPSWIWVFCDWSRAWEKEAIFAQIWVVSIIGVELSIKGAEVKTPEAEVKMSKFLFGKENLPDRVFTSGNVGPDRVSRRASHFCHTTKQCHRRPAWASSWGSGRTRFQRTGSMSKRPAFSQSL